MVEIYSKSLIRTIGKILHIQFSLEHQLKLIKMTKNDLCL